MVDLEDVVVGVRCIFSNQVQFPAVFCEGLAFCAASHGCGCSLGVITGAASDSAFAVGDVVGAALFVVVVVVGVPFVSLCYFSVPVMLSV